MNQRNYGNQGNQGNQGNPGAQGLQGIQGVQGNHGIQGPPGVDLLIEVQELKGSQAVQTEILKILKDDMLEVKQYLIGKPPNHPGLITRVKELETWDGMKNKVLWLVGGTAVGGVFSWVFGKF